LIGADLFATNLLGAKLEHADLRGANLRCQNIDDLKSRGARIN